MRWFGHLPPTFLGRLLYNKYVHLRRSRKGIETGTKGFYKMILKKKITLADMESVDAEIFRSLTWMLYVPATRSPIRNSTRFNRENDVTDVIENTFTVEDDRFGEVVTTDLKEGGKDVSVTEENKKEYVELITEWRIQKRVEDQFKAFLSGFHDLIPQELINVFDERELEVRHLYSKFGKSSPRLFSY